MRILLVDDTVEIRQLVAYKLKKFGEIVQASTGNEAARILESEKFDLIISDFNMPDGKGDAVLAAKVRLGLETPFVFFSSEVGLKPSPGVLAVYDKYQIKELVSLALTLGAA